MNFKKIKLLVCDFDGVMTDNRVLIMEDGTEGVFCDRGDGLGIELLQKKGVEVVVISKETNPVVFVRCKKLKIECAQGIENKINLFLRLVEEKKLSLENVCYIGNDINDSECIGAAGIGVAVADAENSVKKNADYITIKRGGDGAVREICDLILKI